MNEKRMVVEFRETMVTRKVVLSSRSEAWIAMCDMMAEISGVDKDAILDYAICKKGECPFEYGDADRNRGTVVVGGVHYNWVIIDLD